MIDLKRNSKKELVPAIGMRSRTSSIYTPHQTEDFKISRSKFSDFLTCPKCFYLDRVKGLDCQSALNFDPLSASNIYPSIGTVEVVQVVHRGNPRCFV